MACKFAGHLQLRRAGKPYYTHTTRKNKKKAPKWDFFWHPVGEFQNKAKQGKSPKLGDFLMIKY